MKNKKGQVKPIKRKIGGQGNRALLLGTMLRL